MRYRWGVLTFGWAGSYCRSRDGSGGYGIERVLVLVDPQVRHLKPMQVVRESLKKEGVEFDIFDKIRVEPTDLSFSRRLR